MEIKIQPSSNNHFPLHGFLIRNSSVQFWALELQRMQLEGSEIKVYPIPNNTPNSIWGCLCIPSKPISKEDVERHQLCQRVSYNLFIPEKSKLNPTISLSEIDLLFHSAIHVLHPEFGCVKLEEEVNWKSILQLPEEKSYYVNKPVQGNNIPFGIKSFQIKAMTEEEVLSKMDKELFPKKETKKTEPLNLLEKGKLSLYKLLFNSSNASEQIGTNQTEGNGLIDKLASLLFKGVAKNPDFINKMKSDYENLEERNKKELDRLMDLFKNNPKEALKYAIPLDSQGASRGIQSQNSSIGFLKRWGDFSLFGSSKQHYSSGGGSVSLGDSFYTLQNQYNKTAETLLSQGEYKEAAFVYLKLLQNHYKAAEVLEQGRYYQEAATIYLKYSKQKEKAAACYEKGQMYTEAIQLYKELEKIEKVGDLYSVLKRPNEANQFYQLVVDNHTSKFQFIQASDILKYKMMDNIGSQHKLHEGWKSNSESTKCLTLYLNRIEDDKERFKEIKRIKTEELSQIKMIPFLQTIQSEFKKKNEHAEPIREMAYEIVASEITLQPSIIHELKVFNSENTGFLKDVVRFNQSSSL